MSLISVPHFPPHLVMLSIYVDQRTNEYVYAFLVLPATIKPHLTYLIHIFCFNVFLITNWNCIEAFFSLSSLFKMWISIAHFIIVSYFAANFKFLYNYLKFMCTFTWPYVLNCTLFFFLMIGLAFYGKISNENFHLIINCIRFVIKFYETCIDNFYGCGAYFGGALGYGMLSLAIRCVFKHWVVHW